MRGFGTDFATPQTLAKIQDEQAERERARRVKEANLAAYDAARREERSRSGGSVSAMSDVGPGGPSFSNTTIGPDGSVQRDAFDTQSRVGAEFADLARRSAMAQKHNARLGTDSLSAAMRAAMANGGRLPQNLVGLLSRNLGMDGSSQSVYSAGFLNNGDFDIDIVTRGANGGLQRTTRKITPIEQLGIVNSTPGVWGSDGIAVSKRLRNGLRNTYGDSELPGADAYQNSLAAYNTQRQAQLTQKDKLAAMKMLLDYEQKNNRQMDPVTFLRSIPPKLVEQLFPTQYKNPDNPDEGIIAPSKEEVLKTITDFQNGLRQNAAANGGGVSPTVNAILQILMSGDEKPQVPEDVAAFQQGQRERQMREVEEAQARADITRNPQQVINYFKDGRWYSGNGYIRDGRVYDGQGYEIEGATPAEMARNKDGSVYSNENGWVARALPSARELVGGRGGAEAQGGGAAAAQQQGAQADGGQVGGEAKQVRSEKEYTPEQREQARQVLLRRQREGKYNSELSPADEKKFQAWLATLPENLRSMETRDLRGYWKDPDTEKDPQFIDEYRLDDDPGGKYMKPNHARFSDDSIWAEEAAKENELKLIKKIKDETGSVVQQMPDGMYAVSIPGYQKLPEDSVFRRGVDENGVFRTDSLQDALLTARGAHEEHRKIREGERAKASDFSKRLKAAETRIRKEALRMYPENSTARGNYIRDELKKWRMENDPAYKKQQERESASQSDNAYLTIPF